MNRCLLFLSFLVVFLAEILRVYLVMPFPGSQQTETVAIAYWLNNNINYIRIIALIIVAIPLMNILRHGAKWEKALGTIMLGTWFVIFFLFNYRYQADRIFYQPTTKTFIAGSESTDRTKLVIGVVINGEAKAYPIQLIGYHHQVMDTIGNTPVMITYCTVCRAGRAFSPLVNGKPTSFRLVGMDHFNAIFEDRDTKSWWQQATGVAITGPSKGKVLTEFPSTQLTLDAWLRQYPSSLVLQPDTLYDERYFRLEDYDRGTMPGPLVRRDTYSWQPKSWVVGVRNDGLSRAYDWNDLEKYRIIQDSISNLAILLAIDSDTNNFHAFNRRLNGLILNFQIGQDHTHLIDQNTNSLWNLDGLCIEGSFKGQRLERVQAYNEFWHSWQNFNKNVKMFRY